LITMLMDLYHLHFLNNLFSNQALNLIGIIFNKQYVGRWKSFFLYLLCSIWQIIQSTNYYHHTSTQSIAVIVYDVKRSKDRSWDDDNDDMVWSNVYISCCVVRVYMCKKASRLSRQYLMDRKKLQQSCICINARNVRTTIWCCLSSLYECVVCRNIKPIFTHKGLIYKCIYRFVFFFFGEYNTTTTTSNNQMNWKLTMMRRRKKKKEEKKTEKKKNRMIVNI